MDLRGKMFVLTGRVTEREDALCCLRVARHWKCVGTDGNVADIQVDERNLRYKVGRYRPFLCETSWKPFHITRMDPTTNLGLVARLELRKYLRDAMPADKP